jgi:MerR HTH family regulatory protein
VLCVDQLKWQVLCPALRAASSVNTEMVATSLLTIDDLAQETGLTARTIRYYQSTGLLEAVKVPGAGNRSYYPLESVDRLLALRSASWTLPEKASARVYKYWLGNQEHISEIVQEAMVDGATVLQLSDGTIVIRKPLPKTMLEGRNNA